MKHQISFILLLAVSATLALNRQQDCKCKVLSSSRIVGGPETQNVYPWNVVFFQKEFKPIPDEHRNKMPQAYVLTKLESSGIIVNEKTILTHAFPKFNSPRFGEVLEMSYGSNDLIELYNKVYEVEQVIRRPNHSKSSFHDMFGPLLNNLAIIKLKEPIKFGKKVGPACFNLNDVETYNTTLTTIGHGYPFLAGGHKDFPPMGEVSGNRFLREINVLEVSKEEAPRCKNDQLMCVKGTNKFSSICLKDEGAPLMETGNGKTSVIGVASHPSMRFWEKNVIVACEGDQPSVFTKTSKLWNWVRSHVGEDYCV